MNNIVIKRAGTTDVEKLSNIGKQTFSETFAAINTEENMTQYLKESFSLEKLNFELNDKNSEIYFAISDNDIIGYLKVNFGTSQTDLKDPNALEIERIYVLKEFHGKRVGQLLYEKAIQIARQANMTYIWLGVWENNHKAMAFYRKNGFVEFDKHIFKLGEDEQTDILMKLKI